MLAKKGKIALGQEKLFRTIAYCQTSFHTHNDSKYKAPFQALVFGCT